MMHVDWSRLRTLFDETLERPAAEREAFISSLGSDPVVGELRELLRAHDGSGPFDRLMDEISGPRLEQLLHLEPGDELGAYRVVREIGRGGMAVVYEAFDVRHERQVAVKVLRPELAALIGADRFVQEMRTTAKLQHPHIIPLFDSGESAGYLFYVMPYVEGESLREKLSREGRLGLEEAVGITTDVADALDYAHRHGVIHRDIKPGNVLLYEGRPMVSDFGIALAMSVTADGRAGAGVPLGTPDYMSPEQAEGRREITHRSDIYSLGCMLYEMLTGSRPFGRDSRRSVSEQHAAEPVPDIRTVRPSVPEPVSRAIMMAMAKAPSDRYETAAEFARAIQPPDEASSQFRRRYRSFFRRDVRSRSLQAGPPALRSRLVRNVVNVSIAIALLAGGAWLTDFFQTGGQAKDKSIPSLEFEDLRLTNDGYIRAAALAPDGTRLAYCTDSSHEARVVLADLARPSNGRTLAEVYSCGNELFWLPDGSRVIVEAAVLGQVDKLARYTIALPGGSPTRVPCGDGLDHFTISPDGSRCAGNARYGSEILIGALDTATPVDTLRIDGDYRYLQVIDWLPDGRRLAYVTGTIPSGVTAWTTDLDGGDPQPVVSVEHAYSWRWSQDGLALYYLIPGYDTYDQMRLPVTASGLPSGEAERLLTTGTEAAAMSSSSDRLLTVRGTDRSRLVHVSADTSTDPPGSLLTPVTEWIDDWITFSVSNDGAWVAFDSKNRIMKKLLDGEEPERLTREGFSPAWSPDDRYVAYAAHLKDTLRLWLTNAATDTWPAMVRGETLSGIFTSWVGGRLFVTSMTNVQVFDDLSIWSVERQAWLPLAATDPQEADLRRGAQASGRHLLSNDSVGTQILRLLPKPPDADSVLMYWLRTLDGSRATDSTVYWGNWLVSVDGTAQTRLPGEGMAIGWTEDGDGYYVKSWGRVSTLNLYPLEGGEPTPVMTLPADLAYCQLLHGTDPVQLICQEPAEEYDVWLVRPVDSEIIGHEVSEG